MGKAMLLLVAPVLALLALGLLVTEDARWLPEGADTGKSLVQRRAPATPSRAIAPSSPKAGSPTGAETLPAQEQPEATPPRTPAQHLRQGLRLADAQVRGFDALEARRLLTQAVRRHPALVLELAEELGALTNRELAFQVARLLSRYSHVPEVRERLIPLVEAGEPVGREAAIYALLGATDPEATAALAGAFTDPAASGDVQAAAACALGQALPQLNDGALQVVRTHARQIVGQPTAPIQVVAEAVELLDVAHHPIDREVAQNLLHHPEGEVVLAAARTLLQAGAPLSAVRSALLQAELPEEAARMRDALLAETH